MKDAQQDVIEELRRELERSNKAGAATQRHMNLCRDITKCPDDETLAVWLEKKAEELATLKESIASDAEETNNLLAAAEYARKKMEKELSTRVRLDDPVVKGLVEACMPLKKVAAAFDDSRLDDARPDWGDTRESCGHVEVYTGRGGGELLMLRHAFEADKALAAYNAKCKEGK